MLFITDSYLLPRGQRFKHMKLYLTITEISHAGFPWCAPSPRVQNTNETFPFSCCVCRVKPPTSLNKRLIFLLSYRNWNKLSSTWFMSLRWNYHKFWSFLERRALGKTGVGGLFCEEWVWRLLCVCCILVWFIMRLVSFCGIYSFKWMKNVYPKSQLPL